MSVMLEDFTRPTALYIRFKSSDFEGGMNFAHVLAHVGYLGEDGQFAWSSNEGLVDSLIASCQMDYESTLRQDADPYPYAFRFGYRERYNLSTDDLLRAAPYLRKVNDRLSRLFQGDRWRSNFGAYVVAVAAALQAQAVFIEDPQRKKEPPACFYLTGLRKAGLAGALNLIAEAVDTQIRLKFANWYSISWR